MADKIRSGQNLGSVATAKFVVETPLDEEDKKGPLVVMNVGKAGSGKTAALASLAKLPGEKILCNFDPQANASILFLILKQMVSRGEITQEQVHLFKRVQFGSNVHDPNVYPTAVNYLDELRREVKTGKRSVSVVVGDTLTNIGTAAINDVLAANNRNKDIPNRDDYHIAMHAIGRMVMNIAAFPSTHLNIINCHVFRDKDEERGRYENYLMTIGKLQDSLPNLFTEIYYSSRRVVVDEETKGKKVEFFWETLFSSNFEARSAMGIPDPSPQDFRIPLRVHFNTKEF